MRTRLLIVALCFAAPVHAHDTATPDCSVDRDAMLALDEPAFDQSLPNGGWRRLGNIPGCELAAAELIAAWRERHPRASPTVAWHQGQMLAQAGRNAEAIPLLATTRKPVDQDLAGWNHYLDATVAFLGRDRAALLQARASLAAQPYPEASGMPPLVDGYMEFPAQPGQVMPVRMRWPPNLDVVDGLLRCFGKSYAEAYGPACRSEPQALACGMPDRGSNPGYVRIASRESASRFAAEACARRAARS